MQIICNDILYDILIYNSNRIGLSFTYVLNRMSYLITTHRWIFAFSWTTILVVWTPHAFGGIFPIMEIAIRSGICV